MIEHKPKQFKDVVLPLGRHFVTCYEKDQIQIGYDSSMGDIRICLQDKVFAVVPLKQMAGMFEVIIRHNRNNGQSAISCYANDDVTFNFDPKTRLVDIKITDIVEQITLLEFEKALIGTLHLWQATIKPRLATGKHGRT